MRTVKKHDERKNEILDVAESLFYSKGYERCTVNDILRETAIAKGTFYHYFKAKEEVMDAIIARYLAVISAQVEDVLHSPDLSPAAKLLRAFMAMRIEGMADRDRLDDLHRAENALLHQKILKRLIDYMAPVLAKIVAQGIAREGWSCRYPLQSMQIILAAALSLTDEGIFEADAEAQVKIMAALIGALEKMLAVPEDSFLGMYQGEAR